MPVSNPSPAAPMPLPDRATESKRSPSNSSLSPATKRMNKDAPRSTSLRKAKTYSELQAASPVANGKPAKQSRQPSRDAKELRPPTRSATTSFTSSSSALDPLSQHILLKTSVDPTKTPRARSSAHPESPTSDALHRLDSETTTKHVTTPTADPAPRRVDTLGPPKKGPSLLSRLTMRGGKKKDDAPDENDDDRNNIGRVFSSAPSTGGYAYIPHHKEPPRYIKFKPHHKKTCEFPRVFLAQKLAGTLPPSDGDDGGGADHTTDTGTSTHDGKESHETGGAVWAMAFSSDGRYLAAAGRDQVVRVFAVISTPEERRAHEEEERMAHEEEEAGHASSPQQCLSAPVFRGKPVREFRGHTGEVLDLTWSKNNFLLSTAMDRTVRLWHMSRDECLCAFQHKEPVASVAFHPRDDRFFLAGSVDSTLRLWSIPDKSVAYSAALSEVVTAVAFSPDGTTCMAGTLHGLCLFYGTDGLKYQAQIHVRSSRGKNAKGSKITGIHAMAIPPSAGAGAGGSSDGDVKLLVTSTDSRLRIYNLKDKALVAKFKGHENNFTQMRARFSDDGKHIICGSEDKKAYIWPVSGADAEKDKRPYESFDAHSDMLTAAIFAPTATRRLLGGSGDPIYDLCNPPPVTLLSREEANASQTALSEYVPGENPAGARKPEESPAYIARSTHYGGNIIVTSDRTGVIKVFRQDCAGQKRRNENWETGSTFSRKMKGLGRSGSVLTRGSASSVGPSRRTSMSFSQAPTQPPIGISIGPPGSAGLPSDRILSWRQEIESGRAAAAGGYERERSPAVGKGAVGGGGSASEARRHPYSVGRGMTGSPTSERVPSRDGPLPAPSFTFKTIDEDGEEREGKHSRWNIASRWKGIVRSGSGSAGGLGVGGGKMGKESSGLTTIKSEESNVADIAATAGTDGAGGEGKPSRRPSTSAETGSTVYLTDEGGDEREGRQRRDEGDAGEDGEATCEGCGGGEFRPERIGGRQMLLCMGCGEPVVMG